MSDLISRQAAIDALRYDADFIGDRDFYDGATLLFEDSAIEQIKQLPSAVRPTGRWIRTRMPVTGAIEHRCSRCDTPYYMAFAMEMNYCPNCGAKMEVGDGQEKQ